MEKSSAHAHESEVNFTLEQGERIDIQPKSNDNNQLDPNKKENKNKTEEAGETDDENDDEELSQEAREVFDFMLNPTAYLESLTQPSMEDEDRNLNNKQSPEKSDAHPLHPESEHDVDDLVRYVLMERHRRMREKYGGPSHENF